MVGALRMGDQGADSPGAAAAPAARALAERVGARALSADAVERGCRGAGERRGTWVGSSPWRLPSIPPAAAQSRFLFPAPGPQPGYLALPLRFGRRGYSQADGVRGRDRRSGSSWDAYLASVGSGPWEPEPCRLRGEPNSPRGLWGCEGRRAGEGGAGRGGAAAP